MVKHFFLFLAACNYLQTTTLGLLQLRNGIICKYLLKNSTQKDWGNENVNKSCLLNVEIFVAKIMENSYLVAKYRVFVEVFIPPMQTYIISQ